MSSAGIELAEKPVFDLSHPKLTKLSATTHSPHRHDFRITNQHHYRPVIDPHVVFD